MTVRSCKTRIRQAAVARSQSCTRQSMQNRFMQFVHTCVAPTAKLTRARRLRTSIRQIEVCSCETPPEEILKRRKATLNQATLKQGTTVDGQATQSLKPGLDALKQSPRPHLPVSLTIRCLQRTQLPDYLEALRLCVSYAVKCLPSLWSIA